MIENDKWHEKKLRCVRGIKRSDTGLGTDSGEYGGQERLH